MNSVQLVGYLGADPEIKGGGDKKRVCTFSVATTYKRDGNERVTWHRVQVWGLPGKACADHLKKGRLVGVTGRIDNYEYEKDGQKRYGSQVVADQVHFLGANPDKSDAGPEGGEW